MKLVPKVGFKKWSTNFRFEHSNWKNERYTPGNFPLERPGKSFPFTFQLDFDETFCKWETTEERKQSRDYFDLAVVPCNCHLQHSVYIRVWQSRYACINLFICFSMRTSRKPAINLPHHGY